MDDFKTVAISKTVGSRNAFLHAEIGQILSNDYGMEMEYISSKGLKKHYVLATDCKTGKLSALTIKVGPVSWKKRKNGFLLRISDCVANKDEYPAVFNKMLLKAVTA